MARSLAIEFYREALSSDRIGGSVADILRQLRAKYDRQQPVPSYLAYVYYGNPYLRLGQAVPAADTAGHGKPAADGAG